MPHCHCVLSSYLSGTLFSASVGVSLLASPPVVAFCQSKSTRLAAVVGALVLALGVLFTSFAVEFSQLYCSFGTVIGERKVSRNSLTSYSHSPKYIYKT